MNTHADKTQENKSQSVTNVISQKQRRGGSTFRFVDNRPEAIAQRKLQEMANNSSQAKRAAQLQAMADNYSAHQQPIQMNKKKKGKEETISVSRPSHGQEEIQDEMINLWKRNAINDLDQLRADYAWKYKAIEGGWCDGWSYVLSVNGDDLADLWSEIDNLLDGGEQLSSTSIYNACTLARKASLYHIMNGSPPAVNTQQYSDYQEANFDLEQIPESRETWRHDENSTLPIHVIKEEIKSLETGQTLRLTSPVHDAAVKRIKGGYIVSETEIHGVQKCEKLQEALLILEEWQRECEQKGVPFFNQTMIV